MSNLLRSAVKASDAKVKGDKVIDAKHLGTHQIAGQAIVARENGGPESNKKAFNRPGEDSQKPLLLLDELIFRLNPHRRLKYMICTRDSYVN